MTITHIQHKMRLIKTEIEEAAGKIISESGLDALTTEELSKKMEIDQEILYIYFKNNDDILTFMLLNLEHEVRDLINVSETSNLSSEVELHLLFENMFNLLNKKPYHLSILFSIEPNDIVNKNHEILIRIKESIGKYLIKIIDQGKQDTIFKTKLTTRILVKRILGSFRSFMSQQNIIHKMVRDFKKIRDNPD